MALEDVGMAPPTAEPTPAAPQPVPGGGAPDDGVKINDPDILRWMQRAQGQPGGGAPAAVAPRPARPGAVTVAPPRTDDHRAPMSPAQKAYWDKQGIGTVFGNAARSAIPSTAKGLMQIGHAIAPWNWKETGGNLLDAAGVAGSEAGKLVGINPSDAQEAKNRGMVAALKQYASPYTSAFHGDTAPLKKAASMDPFGMAMDVSTPFTLGESAAARAPGIVGKLGKASGTVAKYTDPVRASVAAAKGAAYLPMKVPRFLQSIGTQAPMETMELASKAGASSDPVIRNAYLGAKSGKISGRDILDTVSDAFDKYGRQLKSGAIGAKKASFTQTPLGWGEIDTALNDAKTQAGLMPNAPVNLAHPEYMPGAKNIISRMDGLVQAWKQNPAAHSMSGMDDLRAQLYRLSKDQSLIGDEKMIANNVYNSVRSTMVKENPHYATTLAGIQDAHETINEMRRSLGTGNNIMNHNAINRMKRAFTTPEGRNMLADITKVDPRIPYMIAGAAHESYMPTGLAKYLEGATVLGMAPHLINPATWPAAAGTIAGATAFTSPRFAGASNYAYGVPTRLARSPVKNAAYYAGQPAPPTAAPQDQSADFQNKALPRNARNHNFGNIKDGQFAKNQPGYAGTDGTFARFDTPENGARATKTLIRHYLRSGRDTPDRFAADWAKGGENTDEDRAMYAARLAEALRINHDSKIALNDDAVERVFHAVARQEGSDVPEPEGETSRSKHASGGKVKIDHAAEATTLIRRAERAKNQLGKSTESLLNVPDDHIAKALAVANEAV